jgi:lipopolysaccharide export LptBFGC system permease protein LptF
MQKIKAMLSNERGEAYVGEAVKIVIAIVLGAALLAGLVLVFNRIVLPKTESWIESLFTEAEGYVTTLKDASNKYTIS